jgi:hypothetical protein
MNGGNVLSLVPPSYISGTLVHPAFIANSNITNLNNITEFDSNITTINDTAFDDPNTITYKKFPYDYYIPSGTVGL